MSRPELAPISLKYLIRALIKYQASDLHIRIGRPPLFRIHGKLLLSKMSELTQSLVEAMFFELLTESQRKVLETNRQVDFSFEMGDSGRFRCNLYYQKGLLSAAIRMIPFIIPAFDTLGIPASLKDLCHRPRGLVLITGSTGSGKSTTLAALMQYINETYPFHILTVEDPIEFIYKDKKALVTQREVGSDAISLTDALIGGLRQDPDIIMIGELRDTETIQAALTAAETGHLVFSTLHTNDAKSTIERILDVFEASARNQVRIQLASSLLGVISQQLVMKADRTGRVPACEVMIKSPVIESYILKNEMDRIAEAIATSTSYYNMQTMNQALHALVNAGTITIEEALKSSNSPDDLKLIVAGLSREQGYLP